MSNGQPSSKICYELCYLDAINPTIFDRIGNIFIDLPEIVHILLNEEEFLIGDLKAYEQMLWRTADRYLPDINAVIRNFTHEYYKIEYLDLREQHQQNVIEEVQYLQLIDDLHCSDEDLTLLDSGGDIITSSDN